MVAMEVFWIFPSKVIQMGPLSQVAWLNQPVSLQDGSLEVILTKSERGDEFPQTEMKWEPASSNSIRRKQYMFGKHDFEMQSQPPNI